MSKKSQQQPAPSISPVLLQIYSAPRPHGAMQPQIKASLYAMAQNHGWALKAFHWQVYPLNFHWVEIEKNGEALALLIRHDAPIAALSPTLPPAPAFDMPIEYMDDAEITAAAKKAQAPFAILTAADLKVSLTETDRSFLRQVKTLPRPDLSWKPKEVGQLIFNSWG